MYIASHETAVTIPGTVGNLEGVLALPIQNEMQAIAIICHPHPLHGGTMRNKVVTTLSRIFSELGLANLRFNFRGVGESTGDYGHTLGESEDLLSAIDWLRKTYPEHNLWLAGFSFGSYISARIAAQHSTQLLLSIAPPVNHFDFSSLKDITCPWIVVQGDEDEIVPAQEVYTWIDTCKNPPQLIRMPTATHFFHGQLTDLKYELRSVLQDYL